MKNYKITLQYDGTNYQGWQAQKMPGAVTVQETVENALGRLFGRETPVNAAGRTDSGVHAQAQAANFYTDSGIPPERLLVAINTHLPEDIAVTAVEPVDMAFHARKCALGKHYRYHVYQSRVPQVLGSRYFYQYTYPLDHAAIAEGCRLLAGTHDYSAFCAAGSAVRNRVRTVYQIVPRQRGDLWLFDFYGNGFLRHMVRIMTGTLLEIGRGKLPLSAISAAFDHGERALLGKTVPAKGLLLKNVFYP